MSSQLIPTSQRPAPPAHTEWSAGALGAAGDGHAGGGRSTPELQRLLKVLRDRWRVVTGALLVVVGAVATGTFLQTPVYRASALVELRGQNADAASVEALFQAARLSPQFLGTQYEVLRSPALARRVVASVSTAAPGAAAGAPAERLAGTFAERLLVDPVTGSSLVRVHFESEDPSLAATVVNTLIETYAGMRTEAARNAAHRIGTEVDSARTRLTLAENRLLSHARENGLVIIDAGRGASDNLPQERLRRLQEQLTDAEADRYSKESVHHLREARGEDIQDSEVLQSLNVRLADLRGEYAKLRSTFMDDYPRTKEVKAQIEELEALLARERQRIGGEITGRYLAAVRRQGLLQRAIDNQRALVDRQSEKTAQYRILARDVEAQQSLYAKLQEKRRAAEVAAAVAATDVNVIEPAVAPATPIRPIASRNLQLALALGLLVGVGLAVLREHTDATIRSTDQLESLPIPLLGTIPSIRSVSDGVDGRHAQLVAQEAFGGVRTAVVSIPGDRPPGARTLLITSAQPGDGKTTVAANLALSLARLGVRVLLIDADTRRPAVHRAFGVTPERGLGDYLEGAESWRALVHPDLVPGLDLLVSGGTLSAPTELLSSGRMRALIAEARGAYDYVVVDSPALHINAADTRILAPLVDGVIMVVRSGVTPRALVWRLLGEVPNLAGVVLNDFDYSHFPMYYQSYGAELEGARRA